VLGLSIAAGSLGSGALVALAPVPRLDPLVVPILIGLTIQITGLVLAGVLMTEARPTGGMRGVARSAQAAPRMVAEGVGLLRCSRVLLALVAVELFWGFGMVSYESLMPVRIAEIVGGTQ